MSETSRRLRLQFTLRELFVMITVLGLALPLAVPWLVQARERSRNERCRENLRLFYSGFTRHAQKDPRGRYSSGAYDFALDGCPDQHGWVADLVNSGICRPQDYRCPANPVQGTETLNDLVGAAPVYGSADPFAMESGFCARLGRAKLLPGSPTGIQFVHGVNVEQAIHLVADELLAKGYGTNYATTWFFTRTAPRLEDRKTPGYEAIAPVCSPIELRTGGYRSTSRTLGPLDRDRANSAHVSAACIPILSDANVRPAGATLLAGQPDSSWPSPLHSGAPLAITTSAGPALGNVTGNQMTHLGETGIVVFAIEYSMGDSLVFEEQPPRGVQPRSPYTWLQDFRSFGPVHRDRNGAYCNILFADGSVRGVRDANGDGYLNPGFDATGARDLGSIGYADNKIELPPEQVFSGTFFQKLFLKGLGVD